jgi:Na+-transporting methylmalonyl-CoA/oxaloacetate decarboxylase gamma subunit
MQRIEYLPMTGRIPLIMNDAVLSGIPVAVAGLLIVFSALVLISLFIASLPHILGIVAKVYPEVDDTHSGQSHPESQVADDGAVLAAIGFVLHTEMQRQLAAEDNSTRKG